MPGSIAVRLLGPIEVTGPIGPAVLQGGRQRSLVALLALLAGTAISPERLIDGLWGEHPPRTAFRTLQSHVTRVRQAMAAAGLPEAIASLPAGFLLRMPRDGIDVHVFADLAERGRGCLERGESAEAVTLIREALRLWRGEALQDGSAYGYARSEAERLHDARSSAVEDLCEARLHLGDLAGAIDDLPSLLADHPFRERAANLLMLALYRTGRAADALDVYQRLRDDLADGLGVDPGAALQELYAAMLRQDPSLDRGVSPVSARRLAGSAELPPRVGYFTGRADELAELDKLLAARDTDIDHRVVLISGAAGMGKTALAVQWGHQVAQRFPDGQLFLDLHGHDPSAALDPAAVLNHLLRGLGVPSDRIPGEVTAQVSLYRSLVCQRRLLILLDNAGGIEQVVPAVPPSGASLLVVTSRQELSALAVKQPVHFVHLGAMDDPTGLRLLQRAVTPKRVERELTAAGDLISFCGGMPLAIRIIAARLAGRPALSVRDLLDDVRARRLDALAVPGDSAGIRAVFASAYRSLSQPAQQTFHLLSLQPGPTFTTHLTTEITGDSQVRQRIGELAAAGLIIGSGEDRYRFHDLIRLYAAECARAEERAALRAARSRLFDWYLDIAYLTNRALDPARDRVHHTPTLTEIPFGPSPGEAVTFLADEQPNLTPLVRAAAAAGFPDVAWKVTYLLAGYYDSRGGHDRLQMCEVAVLAAQQLDDPAVEALMRNMLAATYVLRRRFSDALWQLDHALPRARAAADGWLLATTETNSAVANTWLHRYDAAGQAFERALAIHSGNGDRNAVALSLNNLGDLHRRSGHGEQALAYLRQALDIVSTLDNPRLEAIVRQSLGQAHRAEAPTTALEQLRRALALRREIKDRRGEANALHEIGMIQLDLDDTVGARSTLREAVELSRLLGNEHLEAVLLNRLGESLLRTGDLPEAAAVLRQSLHLRERIPDAAEEEHLRRNLDTLKQRIQR